MTKKFYDIKYKGKTGGLLNATVLAKTLGEIKTHAKKLGFKVTSIKPHKIKGGWGL